jgi:hypothetical protein
VHGRQHDPKIPYPNILDDRYLQEIEHLEQDVAENVAFGMRNVWRSNSTENIRDIVKFEVNLLFCSEKLIQIILGYLPKLEWRMLQTNKHYQSVEEKSRV